MKKKYLLLSFGRHSDLLNLASQIKKSIGEDSIEIDILCNHSVVDGEDVSEIGAKYLPITRYFSILFSLNKNFILHSVSPSISSLILCMTGKIFGSKVFYNIHRFDFLSYKGIKKIGVFIYTFLVFSISDVVFVHVKNKKRFLFWSNKLVFAELPKFESHSKKVDGSIKGKEILFFGRIDGNKGLNLLSEIIKLAPDTKFRIVGELVDKSLSNLLKNISLLENVVVDIGRKKSKDLPKVFQNALLVILPYSGGTQSGIPFLARSLKTPVLVSNVGELPETVRDSAFGECVDTRNPSDWLKYIKESDWNGKRAMIAEKISLITEDDIYLRKFKDHV